MARRPSVTDNKRAAAKRIGTKVPTSPTAMSQSRIDQLVDMIDHCTAAKAAAEEIGETFLSYLLSMAIQESRAAMREPNPAARN